MYFCIELNTRELIIRVGYIDAACKSLCDVICCVGFQSKLVVLQFILYK